LAAKDDVNLYINETQYLQLTHTKNSIIEARTYELYLQFGAACNRCIWGMKRVATSRGLKVVSARIISRPLLVQSDELFTLNRNGDLTQPLTVSSKDEVGRLAKGFNGFLSSLRDIVREMNLGAVKVRSYSDETLEMSKELNEVMQRNQASMGATATSIGGLVVNAQEVAGSCNYAAESASKAKQTLSESKRILDASATTFGELNKAIISSNDVISSLVTESQNIGSILSVIRSIDSSSAEKPPFNYREFYF
jgi:methyl-accepting chemotaxis protein